MPVDKKLLRQQFIENGVRVLKQNGNKYVTEENILTDPEYSKLFLETLAEHREKAERSTYNEIIDEFINEVTKKQTL